MDSNLEKCLSLYWNNPELAIFTAKANGLLLDLINYVISKNFIEEVYFSRSTFIINSKGDSLVYSLHSYEERLESVYLNKAIRNTGLAFNHWAKTFHKETNKNSKTKEESLEMFIPYVINHLNEIYPDESTT